MNLELNFSGNGIEEDPDEKQHTRKNNSYKKDKKYTERQSCCSVAESSLTLCDPMDCSMPGFPVLPDLPELAQTHVH